MLILTNGIFDLFHTGHVDFLNQIYDFKLKNGNAYLLVGINSDVSASKLKGPGRPIIPAEHRKRVLEATKYVDEVVIYDTETAVELIWKYRPDVYFKGYDYADAPKTAEQVVVETYGGKVFFTDPPEHEVLHTSDIIDWILKRTPQNSPQRRS